MNYPMRRRPTRKYPLPKDIRSLDEPHPEVIKRRFARCDRMRDGYRAGEDDPLRVTRRSYKTILDKL